MSKLPNISSRNSIQNTENESINNINIIDPSKEEKNIILPIITQENNIDLIKNPLMLNTKLTELETKYLSLEHNYENLINKISFNEKKIMSLQNNMTKNESMNNINKNKMQIKSNNEQDKLDKNFILLNNKIKYLEDMIKNDQEIRVQEKQKELDFTQNLFNKINSSLANTIHMEIEQRFKADMLQKNENIKEIDVLQNQLNGIKSQMEIIQNNFLKKLEENNNECSERNQNLAKYIDIKLDDKNLKKESKELKKFLEKLTEQIKNNMNNQKNENISFEKKIKNTENKLDNSIKEIYDFLSKIEFRTLNKIKNLKKYFEINLLNNMNLIQNNIGTIVKNFEKNFSFFSEELLSYRHYTNLEFQNIHKKIKFNLQSIVTDMENIIKNQAQLENIISNKFKEVDNMKKDIFKEISNLDSKVKINLTNEKILRECQNNIISSEIKNISGSISNTNNAIFSDLNRLLDENTKNKEFMKSKFIIIDKNIINHSKTLTKLEVNLYDTITKLLLNEITQKALEENILEEITKIKLYEKSIKNNRSDINKLNDRIVDAFKSLGGVSQQGTKMNDMLMEKEIRDDVEKMMSRMVEECVLAEAKEENSKKIKNLEDKIEKNNKIQEKKNLDIDSQMTKIQKNNENLVKNLENKINMSNIDISVTQMITNTEIENIYNLINSIKKLKLEAKPEDINLDKVFKLIEENNEITKKALANYSDIIDNKVNNILEKIKKDNIDMWENSISLGQKINTPEEIKKLIQEVPPVISPLNETLQKIMDLNFKFPEPKPFIPDLYENEKIIDEQNYGKIMFNKKNEDDKNSINMNIDNANNNNVNDNKNDINNNTTNNNISNNSNKESEKNSIISKNSKNTKNTKSSGSKKSKK